MGYGKAVVLVALAACFTVGSGSTRDRSTASSGSRSSRSGRRSSSRYVPPYSRERDSPDTRRRYQPRTASAVHPSTPSTPSEHHARHSSTRSEDSPRRIRYRKSRYGEETPALPSPALPSSATPLQWKWTAESHAEGQSSVINYEAGLFPFPDFGDSDSEQNWIGLVQGLMRKSIPGQWFYNASFDMVNRAVRMAPRRGEVLTLSTKKELEKASSTCRNIGKDSKGSLIPISAGTSLKPTHTAPMVIDLGGCVEAWYFGHFTDQCMQHFLQASYALGGARRGLHVMLKTNCRAYQGKRAGVEILGMLGVPEENVHCDSIKAQQEVVSCIAPHTPYLYRLGHKMLTQHVKYPDCPRRVVYFSRARGVGKVSNSGRKMLNEADVMGAIRPIMQRMGLDGPHIFKSASKPFRMVAEELADVCLFFGPHGGAFYNLIFGRNDSSFLEVNPKDHYIGPAALIGAAAGMGYGYIRPQGIVRGSLDFTVQPEMFAQLFERLAKRSCGCKQQPQQHNKESK
eukprot:Hpha_TRINITY_DN22433_c0_g1::TRINITY_DN22433_c0_g1_i1::g.95059::m.95059